MFHQLPVGHTYISQVVVHKPKVASMEALSSHLFYNLISPLFSFLLSILFNFEKVGDYQYLRVFQNYAKFFQSHIGQKKNPMMFKYEVSLMIGCMGLENRGAHAHTSSTRTDKGKQATGSEKSQCMCARIAPIGGANRMCDPNRLSFVNFFFGSPYPVTRFGQKQLLRFASFSCPVTRFRSELAVESSLPSSILNSD